MGGREKRRPVTTRLWTPSASPATSPPSGSRSPPSPRRSSTSPALGRGRLAERAGTRTRVRPLSPPQRVRWRPYVRRTQPVCSEVCGVAVTGRRPGRVCSPRCRIARWRRTRAGETAATLARLQAENTALRRRVAELERLVAGDRPGPDRATPHPAVVGMSRRPARCRPSHAARRPGGAGSRRAPGTPRSRTRRLPGAPASRRRAVSV
jgi:hypothetical protein